MAFIIDMFNARTTMPAREKALAGRSQPLMTLTRHRANGRDLTGPVPDGQAEIFLGIGNVRSAEKFLYGLEGVTLTVAGYSGGFTPNPTEQEVISGMTGHAEVVRVIYDPSVLPHDRLIRLFLEAHDPTQGMRQGSDIGTYVRSVLYVTCPEQADIARRLIASYQSAIAGAGLHGRITTELAEAGTFYPAEDHLQQVFVISPGAIPPLRGLGLVCPH